MHTLWGGVVGNNRDELYANRWEGKWSVARESFVVNNNTVGGLYVADFYGRLQKTLSEGLSDLSYDTKVPDVQVAFALGCEDDLMRQGMIPEKQLNADVQAPVNELGWPTVRSSLAEQ
eukprot:m.26138 g.26138  ORF g.26138 m.26138 type:complete len:118 (-) comp8105_c0_seq1:127-480(-)